MSNNNNKRAWKVLNWNVRGLNSERKWNSIRDKIVESRAEVICLQETKREFFDISYLRNFCPADFDMFEYLPSVGASGGILIAWKGIAFSGQLMFSNCFAISMEFTSRLNNDTWMLTVVYAPCTDQGKRAFIDWFRNIQMPAEVAWLVVGDFNLIRRPEDRNRDGADPNEMFMFNEAISKLGVIELPLLGRQYTWTNKQTPPLLERLDWFFTSNSWTEKFPNTSVKILVMEVSDHWPCVIEISTNIPSSNLFRFENIWLEHENFIEVVVQGWDAPGHIMDPARKLTAKFKSLRKALKDWKAQLPNLAATIRNVKLVLNFLETVEIYRDLSIAEWNFRRMVSEKLIELLRLHKIYWKQRAKIRWVREGDSSTKYFHAHATISHRKNSIPTLLDDQQNVAQAHDLKADLLWKAFRERMGTTEYTEMFFNIDNLI